MADIVRWCQMDFRQDTDAARAFSCMRELDHKGNCDSPLAQEVLREWATQRWEVSADTINHLGG